MRLSIYASFEPARLGPALQRLNEIVPLVSSIEVYGLAWMSWGLGSIPGKDELRAYVLDPDAFRTFFGGEVPAALAAAGESLRPFLVLCPAEHRKQLPDFPAGDAIEVIDAAAEAKRAGVTQIFDAESDRIAGVPYTDDFYLAMATSLFRRAWRRHRPGYKVIAVDCDNTLWRGLCAEQGPGGVDIGVDQRALHELLLRQKRAGRVLTLISKNVPEDVEAVFATRKDLGLSLGDVVALRVGWEPKPQALKSLARELRLSLDSFIFIDDSPAECAEMRAALPEVAVIELPAHGVVDLLNAAWPLDVEDGGSGLGERRTALYRDEASRRDARAAAPTFAEYLRSLNLRCQLLSASDTHLGRLIELAQRTNQFTTNGRRPTASDVRRAFANGHVMVVNAADRFGDYGLCGAVFLHPIGSALRVARLLLSCRVLGRGVEEAVTDTLLKCARTSGLASLEITFTDSGRNLPARRFLERLGGDRRPLPEGCDCYVFNVATFGACPRPDGPGAEDDADEDDTDAAQQPRNGSVDWASVARITADPAVLGERLGLGRRRDHEAEVCDVLTVIADVLGRPVSAEDNLYALGADSLRLVRIVARLKSRLGLELPIGDVLQRGDVADLLALAEEKESDLAGANDADFLSVIQSLYDDEPAT